MKTSFNEFFCACNIFHKKEGEENGILSEQFFVAEPQMIVIFTQQQTLLFHGRGI